MESEPVRHTGLLNLPRELRDIIIQPLLQGLPVFMTQWTCSRSAVAHLQGLSTRVSYIEHPTSASASLDFYARSPLLQVNHQLREEALDTLRLAGYYVYVVTHCRQMDSALSLVPGRILARLDALYLTDACRCSDTPDTQSLDTSLHSSRRDRVLAQTPRLRHLYLGAATTLAAVDLEMMGLYLAFFAPLKTARIQAIYVECGAVSKGNYAADVDYERTWLLGPPRSRHISRQQLLLTYVMDAARRRALKGWLVCRDLPGYVNAFWPLPVKRAGGLRFILECGDRKGSVVQSNGQ